MLQKQYDSLSFKALGTDRATGQFEALVAMFGNIDRQGDRLQKGAFELSLERWRKSGDDVPVIFSHMWQDPFALIGGADPRMMEETDAGLKVIGHLDIEGNPFAAQVFRLMEKRLIREFSFGYEVIREKRAKDHANNLYEVDLIELGPTLKGANPDTQLLGTKGLLQEFATMFPQAEPEELVAEWKEIVRGDDGMIKAVIHHPAKAPSRPRPAPEPTRRVTRPRVAADDLAQQEHDTQYTVVPEKAAPAIPQTKTVDEVRDEWLAKSADDPVMQDLVRVCFNGEPTKAEAARLRRKAAEAEVRRLCDALTTMGVQSPDDVRARAADAAADRERDLQRKDAERQREAELREADRMFASDDFMRRVSRVAITGSR